VGGWRCDDAGPQSENCGRAKNCAACELSLQLQQYSRKIYGFKFITAASNVKSKVNRLNVNSINSGAYANNESGTALQRQDTSRDQYALSSA
jgi:hypothetical protein